MRPKDANGDLIYTKEELDKIKGQLRTAKGLKEQALLLQQLSQQMQQENEASAGAT